MLSKYTLTAVHNLRRHRGFTVLSISGLAIGLAACLVIGLYIHGELTYDRFHEKGSRIYRLGMKTGSDVPLGTARIPAIVGERMADRYQEVQDVVRLFPSPSFVSHDGDAYEEERFFYADPSIFNVFTYPLRRGDPDMVLCEPGTVVLLRRKPHAGILAMKIRSDRFSRCLTVSIFA